jgi:chromosome segregation ATPase
MSWPSSAVRSRDWPAALTVQIDNIAPEYAKLRDDFNRAVTALGDVITAIAQSTDVVNASADGISEAANNLSQRTEQQAASLEETSAALEEITATVRSATERASEATKDGERHGRTPPAGPARSWPTPSMRWAVSKTRRAKFRPSST